MLSCNQTVDHSIYGTHWSFKYATEKEYTVVENTVKHTHPSRLVPPLCH